MSARILVVDDILPNVKLLEAKLKTEYYEVLTATNGQDALDLAQAERPDLILLDIMMPGMDGYEVCRRLKANPDLAHIPVVMITALTDNEDKVHGLDVGAEDFLSKPINDIALFARVRSLVRLKITMDEWRLRESAASQLGVGDENATIMTEQANDGRILIIEDQQFEQNKIVPALEEDHETVCVVSSGPQAIELLNKQAFDVIMLSMNMAAEDGLRLLSYFKSSERTKNLPIVLIGRDEDLPRISHGLEFGAHDYILRPIDKNELRARIRTQLRKRRFQDRLRASYEVSLSMAVTDALTGLYNRRYLEVHLEKLLKKNRENNKAIAVLLMDIDFFKKVNDTHGHSVGDEVLKVFSDRLKAKLRSFDTVARYGGEEFVVLLPEVSTERAYRVAERIRSAIANDPFKCSAPGGLLSITTSIGGTIIESQDNETMLHALERADKELYKAKEDGRNCVYFENKGRLGPEDIVQPTPQEIAEGNA